MQDCWLLLVRYLSRCEFCSQPGVPLLIDAKNERVASWYASYGAVPMLDAPLSLLLPLTTVAAALKSAGKL